MPPADAHPPHVLGRRGEAQAHSFLAACGWTTLARNYRFGRREVDLIMRKGNLVAFVEVKTRAGGGYGPPEEAVTRLKRREIEIVARDFLVRRSLGEVDVRFDVIAIVMAPDGRVVRLDHHEAAWRPESPR